MCMNRCLVGLEVLLEVGYVENTLLNAVLTWWEKEF